MLPCRHHHDGLALVRKDARRTDGHVRQTAGRQCAAETLLSPPPGSRSNDARRTDGHVRQTAGHRSALERPPPPLPALEPVKTSERLVFDPDTLPCLEFYPRQMKGSRQWPCSLAQTDADDAVSDDMTAFPFPIPIFGFADASPPYLQATTHETSAHGAPGTGWPARSSSPACASSPSWRPELSPTMSEASPNRPAYASPARLTDAHLLSASSSSRWARGRHGCRCRLACPSASSRGHGRLVWEGRPWHPEADGRGSEFLTPPSPGMRPWSHPRCPWRRSARPTPRRTAGLDACMTTHGSCTEQQRRALGLSRGRHVRPTRCPSLGGRTETVPTAGRGPGPPAESPTWASEARSRRRHASGQPRLLDVQSSVSGRVNPKTRGRPWVRARRLRRRYI
ncbi:hypothetical protein RJ55_06220 [Drechmeria coniospora]|nr:hypothetical protein RJ55_06220 [Drechmeria coniospora]